uniref:hypothetical protein n=1 Tax=Nonomuraea pusilla TaxID=46177 RepID=UPI0006E206B4|nr:hypothetical protein [Nonomuraea pusilla]
MKIMLTLPSTLTTTFVVAMEHLSFDAESFVPWRVGGPHGRTATVSLASESLRVTHHPSPWKPVGVDLPDTERTRLRRMRQHVVVSSTAFPHELPGTVQAARAVARAVAAESAGLLIDPVIGGAVPGCERCAAEPPNFRLDDGWLAWDTQVHDSATCPPWDPAGTGTCACLRVTSRGLRRFALPEITIDGAACAHNLCATNLLRAVAHRLVTDHLAFTSTHPHAAERPLDDHLEIQPSDQSFLSGGVAGLPFGVRLTPCDDLDVLRQAGGVHRLKVAPTPGTGRISCLRVGPPSGFTGSLNDWLCATQGATRTSLTSPTPARALAA